jgi:cytochrome P450
VRSIARSVLRAVPDDEEVDFVDRVAAPFPVLVIAQLLGIDDGDVDDFRRWSDATIESPDRPPGEGADDVLALARFLAAHVRARVAEPRDDIASAIALAEVGGRSVTTHEAVMYLLSLLIAGNETTRHLVSGGALTLFEHPEQRALLVRDPARIPTAVEECLRWVTPIQAFGRTATDDTRLGEADIGAGDFVVMLYASANRDERAFGPTAGEFDVTRPVDSNHLAFGFGEHLCLGAALARLEARVLFEELLGRFPRYAVVGEPELGRSTLVRGITRMTFAGR